jgi:hypothetical protein
VRHLQFIGRFKERVDLLGRKVQGSEARLRYRLVPYEGTAV